MRIPQLTFTRFIAALAVVVYHYSRDVPFFNKDSIGKLVYASDVFVSYFFVLSGFILVVANFRKNKLPDHILVGKFWLNRVARIYPMYLLALVLYFAVSYSAKSFFNPFVWDKALLSAGMIQAWFPKHVMDYNFPAWSLSIEALFYLSFPLLYWVFNRIRSIYILVIIIVFWMCNLMLHMKMVDLQMNPGLTFYLPIFHLSTFTFGLGSGIIFVREKEILLAKKTLIKFAAILGFAFALYLILSESKWWAYSHNGMMAPVFVLIIYAFSVGNGWISSLFAKRPFEILGESSYALYILQCPIGLLMYDWNARFLHLSPEGKFYSYLFLLTGISIACYFLIEKPIRNRFRYATDHQMVEVKEDQSSKPKQTVEKQTKTKKER